MSPSLDEELRSPPKRGSTCSVGAALANLKPAARKSFVSAMAERHDGGGFAYEGAHIARILSREAKTKINGDTVQRHRKGECRCDPVTP